MGPFELHTRDTAHWRALVTAAESRADCCLDAELEGYLVMVLLRYARSPNRLDERAIADLGAVAAGAWPEQLREVGDKCLVFTGLLPEEAGRAGMPVSYFVEMGRAAYRQLAEHSGDPLYRRLSEAFVALMDVLQAMRYLDDGHRSVDLLALYDLWQETGSQHAYRVLCATTHALPSATANTVKH